LSSASSQSSARRRYQYIAYSSSHQRDDRMVCSEHLLREALPRRCRSSLDMAAPSRRRRPTGPGIGPGFPPVKSNRGTARRFRSSVCSALSERVPPVCPAGRPCRSMEHRRNRVDNERLKQTSTVGRDDTGRRLIEFCLPFVVANAVKQSRRRGSTSTSVEMFSAGTVSSRSIRGRPTYWLTTAP
jgi:hypothetical protein